MEVFSTHLNISVKEMQEHASLLINAFDPEHKILFWNRRCEDYFGISKENALGQKLEVLLPDVAHNERITYLKMAFDGREIVRVKDTYQRKGGYYEQRLIPVKDGEGRVIAVLNVVQDYF